MRQENQSAKFEQHFREGAMDSDKKPESSSRRRPRTTAPALQKAYRLHFSCEHQGRYFRSSKRKIKWVFGLTNLNSLRQGLKGNDCRGEEHLVELIWSLKSGKTRVFWNKRNISNLFGDANQGSMVEARWEARSGESLHIKAHARAVSGEEQYDLLIDGTSFFKLPRISQLGHSSVQELLEEREAVEFDRMETNEVLSDVESAVNDYGAASESLGFRLSMVGLGNCYDVPAEPIDELHSELYSPVLESFRHQVVECLPQTEEMLSRAIISAFFLDSDSQSLDLSLSDASLGIDPFQAQVDAIQESLEWVTLNVVYAPRPDCGDAALIFFQKMINSMVVSLRDEEISSDEAARTLLCIGAVLNLNFANSFPADAVIITGLLNGASTSGISQTFSRFGEVVGCGIARADETFALCRMKSEESVVRIVDAAQKGELLVRGISPCVVVLSENVHHQFLESFFKRSTKAERTNRPSQQMPVLVDLTVQSPIVSPPVVTPEFACSHKRPSGSGTSSASTAQSADPEASSPQSVCSAMQDIDYSQATFTQFSE